MKSEKLAALVTSGARERADSKKESALILEAGSDTSIFTCSYTRQKS
jgi:hypothetical protein